MYGPVFLAWLLMDGSFTMLWYLMALLDAVGGLAQGLHFMIVQFHEYKHLLKQ